MSPGVTPQAPGLPPGTQLAAKGERKEFIHAIECVSGERRIDAVVGNLEETVTRAGRLDELGRSQRGSLVASEETMEVDHWRIELFESSRPFDWRPYEFLGYLGLFPEQSGVEDHATGSGVFLYIYLRADEEEGGGSWVHLEEWKKAIGDLWYGGGICKWGKAAKGQGKS